MKVCRPTNFVYSRHKALHCRVLSCCGKEIIEGWRRDDARHDALVIAEEKKAFSSHI